MHIGVPKEIKIEEYRVGLTPQSVSALIARGNSVTVETGAGLGIGADDNSYRATGAKIAPSAGDIFGTADMIVKVKEPQPVECKMLREGQVLFTYLHLAADRDQAQYLLASGATCLAYETVTNDAGRLPLLAPMSQVAGRLSVQAGAKALEISGGGRGVLLGGVPGTAPAKVTVLGGGVAGKNAIQIALGMGADVTVLDTNVATLEALSERFGPKLKTMYSAPDTVFSVAREADLIIGAVLIPGARAPCLISADMIKKFHAGSVLVDIAIDQGGCFETSVATTHSEPTYVVDEVVHYCVANMPGAVPRTSTYALNNVTLPWIIRLCDNGVASVVQHDAHFRNGLNVYNGQLTNKAVSEDLGLAFVDPASCF
ncbi:MAG: alanine dehydrogenase [Rhodospirillaceae bacterium TMED167]|nr:alanine dehydrogenase [Rhodospirillaceae bacterium]OUW27153.1 MAG: alanine dehydrogenase [Rhodospirillaceae bacterium TMED167]